MKLVRLSTLARNRIELLRAGGIDPDYEDVLTLHYLGKRLEDPDGTPGLSILGNPVKVGNITLWPWSIGAERWYNTRAAKWYSDDPTMLFSALVFSLAYSNDPGKLKNLFIEDETTRVIDDWLDSLTATRTQIVAAVDKLMPERDRPAKVKVCPECQRPMPTDDADDFENLDEDLDDTAFLGICEMLMKAYPGTTLEYWQWSTPKALTFKILDRYIERESEKAGSKSTISAQMRATHAFEVAARQIRDKHLARQNRAKTNDVDPEDAETGGKG